MVFIIQRFGKQAVSLERSARFARYAAGEILLLVIGILIALQIDGWREEQREREQEAYYLQRLTDEFAFNLAEAERNIHFSENQVRFAELLLASLDSELNETDQVDWLYALNYLWFLPHPFYEDAAWSELQSTGKLDLIRNRALVARVGTFHSQLDHLESLEDEWDGFHLRYRAAVNNVLDDDLRVEIGNKMSPEMGIYQPIDRPVDLPHYIEKLSGIDGIEGLIRDIWINREVAAVIHGQRKAEIESILQLLQQ